MRGSRTDPRPRLRRRGRLRFCASPVCIRPRRKVPVVTMTARQVRCVPSARMTPATVTRPADSRPACTCAVLRFRSPRLPRERSSRFGHVASSRWTSVGVFVFVRLRPRPPDGRALGAVEHAELDAGGVGGDAHQPAEGVDLADHLPLGQPADGGVAGHLRRCLVGSSVTSATDAPRRDAAQAASAPAWPPPMTMMS